MEITKLTKVEKTIILELCETIIVEGLDGYVEFQVSQFDIDFAISILDKLKEEKENGK